MTLEDAYRKLTAYIDGSLSPDEVLSFDEQLRTNPDLAEALRVSRRIESFFEKQEWLEPSETFTRTVVARALVEAPRPLPTWVRMWEPTKISVSFFTLGLLLALGGRSLLKISLQALKYLGVWLDALFGSRVFEVNPLYVIAVILPIIVGGWATCVITGRCRVVDS